MTKNKSKDWVIAQWRSVCFECAGSGFNLQLHKVSHELQTNTRPAYRFEDGKQHMFLSYEGLCLVISFCNRQEILNRDKMAMGERPEVKDEEWHEVKEDSKVISFEERRRQA